MAAKELEKNFEEAKHAIATSEFGSAKLKKNLIELMEKRWSGTFALIGKVLLQKQ